MRCRLQHSPWLPMAARRSSTAAAAEAAAPSGMMTEVGAGEGQFRHHRLGWLHRARRNRPGLRLGHSLEESDRLQGHVRSPHVRTRYMLHEPGRLRPVTALATPACASSPAARCSPSTSTSSRSWSKTVDERLQDAPVAHGGRPALRHALPMGRQRAHVQHRDLPGSTRYLGRHLPGAGTA